jgi:regulatory protein YycH of two-component signal transduction system YycFG
MRYETIKSSILFVLVLLSIFLTWNLWTYQPNYATMEKSSYVAEVSLSEKQEVKKIIKPDLVLFHQKNSHYGTVNSDEIDKMIKEITNWRFLDIKNYTDKVPNISQLENANGSVEFIFPAEVPIQLFRDVLSFEDKKVPEFNFDRFVVNVENSDKETGTVYFVSSAQQQVYISHVSTTFLNTFYHDFYKNANQYPAYFSYNLSEKRTVFLPEYQTEMMEYKYLPVTLNSEEFRDALFTDPSFVQKSFVANGEEYTNGSSKMNIDYDSDMLIYVNPTAASSYQEKTNDLVKRGIDFVNDHGGWTDAFRYVDKDETHHQMKFRLYSVEGYPVFNEAGLSEINETWGPNEINKYIRPNISLDLPLKTEMQKITIASGHEVIQFLKNKKNIKLEQIDNLILGYEMEKDSQETKLIRLEPAWYYRYNKIWYSISLDELRGNK